MAVVGVRHNGQVNPLDAVQILAVAALLVLIGREPETVLGDGGWTIAACLAPVAVFAFIAPLRGLDFSAPHGSYAPGVIALSLIWIVVSGGRPGRVWSKTPDRGRRVAALGALLGGAAFVGVTAFNGEVAANGLAHQALCVALLIGPAVLVALGWSWNERGVRRGLDSRVSAPEASA